MTLNNKKIQLIMLALVILAAGYFGWQEFFNKKQNINYSNDNGLYEFKVVRTDFTEEQITRYRQEFDNYLKTINAAPEKFDYNALNAMAIIKKILHDYQGAGDIWNYVGEKRPKNSLSFYNLGMLYTFDLKDNELAEKNFLQALANAEGEVGNEQYYYGIADFYNYNAPEKKGNLEKILLAAIEAEQYKDSLELITLLARYYSENKQKDLALKYWQKALLLSPNNDEIKTEINNLKK
mgnify:CR=1 FL=1